MSACVEVSDGVESLLLLGKVAANGAKEKPELSEEVKQRSPLGKIISDSSRGGDSTKQQQSKSPQSPPQVTKISHKLPAKLMAKTKRKEEGSKKNIVGKSTSLSDKMKKLQNDSLRPCTTARIISSSSERKSIRDEVPKATVEKDPMGIGETHEFQLSGMKRKRLGMIDSAELKKNMLNTLAIRQEQLQRHTKKLPALPGNSLQQVSVMIESAKAASCASSEREIIRRALRAQRDTAFLDSMNALGAGAANFTVAQAWGDQNLALQLSSLLSKKGTHLAPPCNETKSFPIARSLAEIAHDYTLHRKSNLGTHSQKFHFI